MASALARALLAEEEDTSCSYTSPEGCPHHPALLELGLCVDLNKPNEYVLLLVVIVFSVIIELLVHRVDHWATHHRTYEPILNNVYRELMLLGIISFFLYLAETTQWCALRRNLDVESFEFAHYLVFFVSLFYILTVLFLLLVVRSSYKRWNAIQLIPVAQVESHFQHVRQQWEATPWFMVPFKPALIRSYYVHRNAYTFMLMRTSFLSRFQEPIIAAATKAHRRARMPAMSNDALLLAFDFTRFLRKCTRHVLLRLLKLSAPVVVLLVTFIVIQIIRLSQGGSVSVGIIGWIGIQGYLMLVPFFLLLTFALRYRLSAYRKQVIASGLHILPFVPLVATMQKQSSHSNLPSRLKSAFGISSKAGVRENNLQSLLDSPEPGSRLSHRSSWSQQRTDWYHQSIRVWNLISPNVYFSLLQIITYWQCFYVAGALLYIHIHIVHDEDNSVGFHILTWLPPVFAFTIALPMLLPTYTVLACVNGQFSDLIPSVYRGEAYRHLVAIRKEHEARMHQEHAQPSKEDAPAHPPQQEADAKQAGGEDSAVVAGEGEGEAVEEGETPQPQPGAEGEDAPGSGKDE